MPSRSTVQPMLGAAASRAAKQRSRSSRRGSCPTLEGPVERALVREAEEVGDPRDHDVGLLEVRANGGRADLAEAHLSALTNFQVARTGRASPSIGSAGRASLAFQPRNLFLRPTPPIARLAPQRDVLEHPR